MDLMNFRMRAAPISTTAIGHTSSVTLSQQRRPLAASGQGNPSRTSRREANSFLPRSPCAQRNLTLRGGRLPVLQARARRPRPQALGNSPSVSPGQHLVAETIGWPRCFWHAAVQPSQSLSQDTIVSRDPPRRQRHRAATALSRDAETADRGVLGDKRQVCPPPRRPTTRRSSSTPRSSAAARAGGMPTDIRSGSGTGSRLGYGLRSLTPPHQQTTGCGPPDSARTPHDQATTEPIKAHEPPSQRAC